MVLDMGQLLGTWLGGPDGNFSVKLSAIGRNDLGPELFGQTDGKVGLANGRRAAYHIKNWRLTIDDLQFVIDWNEESGPSKLIN